MNQRPGARTAGQGHKRHRHPADHPGRHRKVLWYQHDPRHRSGVCPCAGWRVRCAPLLARLDTAAGGWQREPTTEHRPRSDAIQCECVRHRACGAPDGNVPPGRAETDHHQRAPHQPGPATGADCPGRLGLCLRRGAEPEDAVCQLLAALAFVVFRSK